MTARACSALALLLVLLLVSTMQAQSAPNIHTATLGESGAKTPEISTEELRRILAGKSAMVFDVRPAMEFATSHIPGAVNVAQKPGTSKALYVSDVAEISRLLGGDRAKPVVMYCNGPFCGKSKRVSEDLLAAGFTNVRRYQLGIPVWLFRPWRFRHQSASRQVRVPWRYRPLPAYPATRRCGRSA